ncbi:hypothetical protein CR513_50914, partial [Mucuna pruriens]
MMVTTTFFDCLCNCESKYANNFYYKYTMGYAMMHARFFFITTINHVMSVQRLQIGLMKLQENNGLKYESRATLRTHYH